MSLVGGNSHFPPSKLLERGNEGRGIERRIPSNGMCKILGIALGMGRRLNSPQGTALG